MPFGAASWARINSASMPPTKKNTKALTPYMIPIFLWSTVNSQDVQPFDDTGRRNTPNVVEGVTSAGVGTGATTSGVGVGRSMIAMAQP